MIPFVVDAIRRSNGRSGYRSVSSDGGSSRGGGSSRRHLIDYSELPDSAAAAKYVEATAVRRGEEHGRPAAVVVAGSAYRRK